MVIRSKEAHHDDEDIAVSARARHELVGAGRTKALAEIDQETASVTGSKIGANVDLSGASGGATAASSFPSKGAASMAGMSLGFNLKESLPRSTSGVEEMDSDESTSSRDGFDGEDDDSIEDLDLHNLSHKSLITSYADITPDKLRNVSTPRSEADPHITCTPGEVGGPSPMQLLLATATDLVVKGVVVRTVVGPAERIHLPRREVQRAFFP